MHDAPNNLKKKNNDKKSPTKNSFLVPNEVNFISKNYNRENLHMYPWLSINAYKLQKNNVKNELIILKISNKK